MQSSWVEGEEVQVAPLLVTATASYEAHTTFTPNVLLHILYYFFLIYHASKVAQ